MTATLFAGGFRLGTTDGAFFYGFGPQELLRVPLAGGAPTTLVDGIRTAIDVDLIVDAQWAYWIAIDPGGSFDNQVIRAPKTGGVAAAIGGGGFVRGLTVAGEHLYWNDANQLLAIPKTGASQSTLVAGEAYTTATATDGQSLWYFDNASGAVESAALLSAPGRVDQAATYVAVDAQFLYRAVDGFGLQNGGNNGVLRHPKAGGSPTPVSPSWTVKRMRLAGGALYVALDTGALWRVNTDGSSPTHLADGATDQLLVLGDSVYFTRLTGIDRQGDTYRVCK
jgi:hypothetical protein